MNKDQLIRGRAYANGLNPVDVTHAVDAITYQKRDDYALAKQHKEAIQTDTPLLWEIAGEITETLICFPSRFQEDPLVTA